MRLLYLILLIIIPMGCDDFLGINDDPNVSTRLNLSNTLGFAQVSLTSNLLEEFNTNAGSFTRMWYTTAIRDYDQNQGTYSEAWTNLYAGPLADLQVIIDEAPDEDQGYRGIARLLKAYGFSVLTDLFGDVPYFQAANPSIPFADLDNGAAIYADLLAQIDIAISEINSHQGTIQGDMIYGGSLGKWVKMGNTLKLKLYAQARKEGTLDSEAGFQGLISGNIISSTSDDFQQQYGAQQAPFQNRHPLHVGHYNQATDYWMDNWMMANLLNNGIVSSTTSLPVSYRTIEDPRLRYYIFRQVPDDAGGAVATCQGGGCPIGLLDNGYLGRDAGDPSAFSNEGALIATFGVYPIAGLADQDQPKTVSAADGTGQGIFPMLTAYMVKFLHAEMALTTNVPGDPLTLLKEGIQLSMDKTRAFGATQDPSLAGSAFEITQSRIDNYIANVETAYNNATNDDERLNIIMTEYHLSLFGNGIEAYNNYRRTGFPNFAETAPVMGDPPYPQRFIIPVSELETNPKLADYTPNAFEPVFWDID